MSTFTGRWPDPATIATGIGAGRLAIGGVVLAAPTTAVRLLGVDSASAKRMVFLARMTAARDASLGIGTLVSRGTPQVSLWLAAGAASDGVDALVIAGATRRGVTRGVAALGSVLAAAAAAGAAGWAAVALSRPTDRAGRERRAGGRRGR